jgi:hypothetical protein
MANEIPVKEIGQILDEVSTKIPKLIHSLLSNLYSAEAGTNMGQAVGNLYKELIEAGIPQEDALQMAKDYIQSIKGFTDSLKSEK